MTIIAVLVLQMVVSPPVLATSGPGIAPEGRLSSGGPSIPLAPGANFPTYLGSPTRTSNSTGEQLINSSDVSDLRTLWRFTSGASAAPQPIAVNGIVYEGSWTGYEYALYATNGTVLWKTFLGHGGNEGSIGITSTASWDDGTLYVGGGNSTLYGLNASTGAILWSTLVGAKGQNYYIWTSPLINGKFVYLGVDSFFDSPLVGSGLNQYDRSNGTLVHSFNTSVPFVNGSGIWSSPSLSGSTIFVTTGNPPGQTPGNYSESVISFNDASLTYLHLYQVNRSQFITDGDFGATPTAFSVPTAHGAVPMVAAANKNGILYAWYQSNLTLSWSIRVANSGNDTIISTAWNGHDLYDIGPGVSVDGAPYNGSVRALDPLTGRTIWQVGLPQPWSADQYGAPLCFNGLVVVPDNHVIYFLNATTGTLLFQYKAVNTVMGAVSVSRGELYLGLAGGKIIALDLRLSSTATASHRSGPGSVAFQVSPTGGLPRYSFAWNFGDGSTSQLQKPSHVYLTSGTYHVSVTVTDLAGTVSTDHLSVVVTSGAASVRSPGLSVTATGPEADPGPVVPPALLLARHLER